MEGLARQVRIWEPCPVRALGIILASLPDSITEVKDVRVTKLEVIETVAGREVHSPSIPIHQIPKEAQDVLVSYTRFPSFVHIFNPPRENRT